MGGTGNTNDPTSNNDDVDNKGVEADDEQTGDAADDLRLIFKSVKV